jgi:hypothetical protein
VTKVVSWIFERGSQKLQDVVQRSFQQQLRTYLFFYGPVMDTVETVLRACSGSVMGRKQFWK